MKDGLGSIINILDCNENVKTTYSYDAFGEPSATYHSGQIDSIYRFTGRVFDAAIGSYYYRARYYDQNLGRFFSRDPLFLLQSLYIHCNNSPVSFTDPTGSVRCSGSTKTKEDCLDCCAVKYLVAMTEAHFKRVALYELAAAWDYMAWFTVAGWAYLGGLVGALHRGGAAMVFGSLGGSVGAGIDQHAGYSREGARIRARADRMYKADTDRAKSRYDRCKDSCKAKPSGSGAGALDGQFVIWGPFVV